MCVQISLLHWGSFVKSNFLYEQKSFENQLVMSKKIYLTDSSNCRL